MRNGRWLRRISGFFSARIPELGLEQVADPRARRGRRWKLDRFLHAMLCGLMSGAKTLRDIEVLTEQMSGSMRRAFGFERRIADTTLRAALCRLSPSALRAALHRLVWAAKKRKVLAPVGLPFGMVAMDGKSVVIGGWGKYAQRVVNKETHRAYGHLRTVTSTLVSAQGRPCIDAYPVPKDSNEMGGFSRAFKALLAAHKDLFRLVSYDAGAASEENAALIVKHNKDYLFAVKDDRRLMKQHAKTMLDPKASLAETEDVLSDKTVVHREVRLHTLVRTRQSIYAWAHAKTMIKVTSHTEKAGQKTVTEERYYVSSMDKAALSAEQWLRVVREHWGVEVTHNILDVALEEDDNVFISFDDQGALSVILLRRMAYTLLTLFRSVTLRSDEHRNMPWRQLIRRCYTALVAAGPEHVKALRGETQLAFV